MGRVIHRASFETDFIFMLTDELVIKKINNGCRKATFKGDEEHTFLDHCIPWLYVSIPGQVSMQNPGHAKIYA